MLDKGPGKGDYLTDEIQDSFSPGWASMTAEEKDRYEIQALGHEALKRQEETEGKHVNLGAARNRDATNTINQVDKMV